MGDPLPLLISAVEPPPRRIYVAVIFISKLFCEVDSGSDIEDHIGSGGNGKCQSCLGLTAKKAQKIMADESNMHPATNDVPKAAIYEPATRRSSLRLVLHIKPIKMRENRKTKEDADRK